jgi:hypothetical protein
MMMVGLLGNLSNNKKIHLPARTIVIISSIPIIFNSLRTIKNTIDK